MLAFGVTFGVHTAAVVAVTVTVVVGHPLSHAVWQSRSSMTVEVVGQWVARAGMVFVVVLEVFRCQLVLF